MEVIENRIIDTPTTDGGDGLVLYGPDREYLVRNCIFDYTKIDKSKQDELLSFVQGPKVKIDGCVFIRGIKALLAGNGDNPFDDGGKGRFEITNSAFLYAGRRCPEAQDGVIVNMRSCWIHNWGETFDVRAFGAWAHRGGRIFADNCVFTQTYSPTIKERLLDFGKHVGQAFNDKGGLRFISGFNRGLVSGKDGEVISTRCYRNRKSIALDNCAEYIDFMQARKIIQGIQEKCPDVSDRLGASLVEIFNKATAQ